VKVLYYLDTSTSINWGSQATSAGMRQLIENNHPEAEFIPYTFAPLPLKLFPFLRIIADKMLLCNIRKNNLHKVKSILSWYGIDQNIYNQYDVVCFNGEGAMHDQSGHFFRMLASLYAFKANGKKVISMNQTIDVKPGSLHAAMLQAVYPQLDAVLVREPLSHRLLNQLNIPNTVLGDAAYALPRLSEEEIEQHFRTFNIDTGFIALTASSILDRNARSIATMEKIIRALKPLGRRIVFLANTKTDLYLAKKIAQSYHIQIISYKDAQYKQAMAIIAKADLLVGGRQHPNIFAAIYQTPFIGLAGNTHKMQGVMELLNYPIQSKNWDISETDLRTCARDILDGKIDFSAVTVPIVAQLTLY
jgi:polysaccharide pyruvyl transferase WcaK-like protein